MPTLRLSAFFLLVLALPVRAQSIIRHPDPSASIADRWEWAEAEAKTRCAKGCWIAYSFHRMMESSSFTGWWSDEKAGAPTLQSLVYGREVEPLPDRTRKTRNAPSQKVRKEVALLFRYDSGGRSLQDINISNISLPTHLDGLPLFWLGRAEQAESIQLLKGHYGRTSGTEPKEDLVSAVGMHDDTKLVLPFLRDVLAGREHEEIREQAVFWIAEADDPAVLPLLEKTVRSDRSQEVREQAVFGISRIETEAADELLIDLARHLDDRETREQAIFWLGQNASKKAVAGLDEIAANDPDVEIQKKAVFAISQLPEDEGIPRLIKIARSHPKAPVRHDAIFWLGESGDPRAVEVLVEIVRGR